jgi:hypothetical protein
MTDRFDLEQHIMKCWQITDDLDLIATMISETNMEAEDQDKYMNILIGMKELYNARFDILFRTFENMVQRGQFKTVAWNPGDFQGLDEMP